MNIKFEDLIKDENVIKVAKNASTKFSYTLSKDEIETCILNAIWKASKKYDENFGVKFTTYLHRGVVMECLSQAKFNQNKILMKLHSNIICKNNKPNKVELMDQLEKCGNPQLLIDYYIGNKTIKELALEHKVCGETIRLKIKKSINKIKDKE